MAFTRSQSGQASVELVALLPLVAVIGLVLWQAVVAGQAAWLAGSSARAAARAGAVGGDIRGAAAGPLPRVLRRGLQVDAPPGGTVRVRIGVPAVVGAGRLATITATAHVAVQR
jgi:hypothetical protein